MDSTDEKVHQKARLIKEAEMKDKAKLAGRDIAKKRLENNYKLDEMVAISSKDFNNDTVEKPIDNLNKSPNKYDDMLN